jgi:colicin import membrane protein
MKVRVDDMGKAYVAQLKELPKVVDAERKRFRDTLDAMADEVRAPLTEYEDREKTRVSEREEWIATILRYDLDPDACDITRLDSARTVIKTLVETMDWQEFSKRAYDAYAKVDASLREKIACKVQAEQEQAA